MPTVDPLFHAHARLTDSRSVHLRIFVLMYWRGWTGPDRSSALSLFQALARLGDSRIRAILASAVSCRHSLTSRGPLAMLLT